MTLGKLFMPLSPSSTCILIWHRQRPVTPCGWGGNRRSNIPIAIALHSDFSDPTTYGSRHSSFPRLSLLSMLTNTLPGPSASEVTTLWRYRNLFIIIIIMVSKPTATGLLTLCLDHTRGVLNMTSWILSIPFCHSYRSVYKTVSNSWNDLRGHFWHFRYLT